MYDRRTHIDQSSAQKPNAALELADICRTFYSEMVEQTGVLSYRPPDAANIGFCAGVACANATHSLGTSFRLFCNTGAFLQTRDMEIGVAGTDLACIVRLFQSTRYNASYPIQASVERSQRKRDNLNGAVQL